MRARGVRLQAGRQASRRINLTHKLLLCYTLKGDYETREEYREGKGEREREQALMEPQVSGWISSQRRCCCCCVGVYLFYI